MNPQVEAALIAGIATLISVGGTVMVALRGYRATRQATADAIAAQRDQLDRTLAEQQVRTLNERFAAAADKLGMDKPATVRLAGVYAMAGLADDWEDNRQTCIDVLCGYLRIPYAPDPGDGEKHLEFLANREVRHTVIRVIAAHLREEASVSWCGADLDFTGVVFDGGDFHGAEFSGGRVSFKGAEFFGGTVSFMRARLSGGSVDFWDAKFSGGTLNFMSAKFSGGSVSFEGAEFSGGTVIFLSAEFSGGVVSFLRARFSGGSVDFGAAEFPGGSVDFAGASFSGGTVDFAHVSEWHPGPLFDWAADAMPPAGVVLVEESPETAR